MICRGCTNSRTEIRKLIAEIKRLKDENYVLRMRVSKKVADEIDEDMARCVDQTKERNNE